MFSKCLYPKKPQRENKKANMGFCFLFTGQLYIAYGKVQNKRIKYELTKGTKLCIYANTAIVLDLVVLSQSKVHNRKRISAC